MSINNDGIKVIKNNHSLYKRLNTDLNKLCISFTLLGDLALRYLGVASISNTIVNGFFLS